MVAAPRFASTRTRAVTSGSAVLLANDINMGWVRPRPGGGTRKDEQPRDRWEPFQVCSLRGGVAVWWLSGTMTGWNQMPSPDRPPGWPQGAAGEGGLEVIEGGDDQI